jgi:uncharacterized membrane protein YedE/YeeE
LAYQSYLLALVGGGLIGLAATIMLATNGRICGISGISKGLLAPRAGDWPWRVAFIAGLVAGGGVFLAIHPAAFQLVTNRPLGVLALAGLCVGFGTVMCNGCTSGHGVCGISRLSRRSIVATLTFVATGMATATLYQIVVG